MKSILLNTIVLVVGFCSSTALARDTVLAIGVDNQVSPSFWPLEFSARDAENFYSFLKYEHGFVGQQLTSKEAAATIREQIRRYCSTAQSDDTFIFYFSGHGYQYKGKQYLVTAHTPDPYVDIDNALKESISVEDTIQKYFQQSQAKNKAFIIDACFNNLDSDKGLAAVGPRSATLIARSCSSTQKSFEDENIGSSIYTHYLLERLKSKPTLTIDKDTLNAVSLDVELHAKKRGEDQVPTFSGSGIDFEAFLNKGRTPVVSPSWMELSSTGFPNGEVVTYLDLVSTPPTSETSPRGIAEANIKILFPDGFSYFQNVVLTYSGYYKVRESKIYSPEGVLQSSSLHEEPWKQLSETYPTRTNPGWGGFTVRDVVCRGVY